MGQAEGHYWAAQPGSLRTQCPLWLLVSPSLKWAMSLVSAQCQGGVQGWGAVPACPYNRMDPVLGTGHSGSMPRRQLESWGQGRSRGQGWNPTGGQLAPGQGRVDSLSSLGPVLGGPWVLTEWSSWLKTSFFHLGPFLASWPYPPPLPRLLRVSGLGLFVQLGPEEAAPGT